MFRRLNHFHLRLFIIYFYLLFVIYLFFYPSFLFTRVLRKLIKKQLHKVIPGYSAPPTTATTPSTYSPRTNGGAGGGGGLAGDAFWAKNTGPSSSPQKGGGGGSGGILSKVLDVVVGPDIEPYGFILGSLEEGDERHLKQLNTTLPNDKTIPGFVLFPFC